MIFASHANCRAPAALMIVPQSRVAVPKPVRSAFRSMVTVRCGGSPAVVGQSCGAGQPADLQQGISVALQGGPRVADVLGRGTGCDELFDQGSERGAVLGPQESLQPQPCSTIEPRYWARQAAIACLRSSCVAITSPLLTSPPPVLGVQPALRQLVDGGR